MTFKEASNINWSVLLLLIITEGFIAMKHYVSWILFQVLKFCCGRNVDRFNLIPGNYESILTTPYSSYSSKNLRSNNPIIRHDLFRTAIHQSSAAGTVAIWIAALAYTSNRIAISKSRRWFHHFSFVNRVGANFSITWPEWRIYIFTSGARLLLFFLS